MTQGLLEVVEKATELETLLHDNLLRQQQELNQALGSADVESDRYHPLQYVLCALCLSRMLLILCPTFCCTNSRLGQHTGLAFLGFRDNVCWSAGFYLLCDS